MKFSWPWLFGGAVVTGVLYGFARRSSGTVFTIVMENKGRSEVLDPQAAPFLTSLANQYCNLTNYVSRIHPSLPNYIQMTSGSTAGITDDTGHRIAGTDNLAAQLDAAGVSWRAYGESMPSPCFAGDTNLYAVRHMPFSYYDYVRRDPAYCASHIVPFTQFWSDLTADAPPRFMWITPNMVNNMHDGTVADGDSWLNSVVPAIMSSPAYLNGGVIFILFDEGERGEDTLPAVIVSERLRGVTDATRYDHKSYLAAVQDILGLGRLTTTAGIAALPR